MGRRAVGTAWGWDGTKSPVHTSLYFCYRKHQPCKSKTWCRASWCPDRWPHSGYQDRTLFLSGTHKHYCSRCIKHYLHFLNKRKSQGRPIKAVIRCATLLMNILQMRSEHCNEVYHPHWKAATTARCLEIFILLKNIYIQKNHEEQIFLTAHKCVYTQARTLFKSQSKDRSTLKEPLLMADQL